jgi:hypothetical protein
MLIKLPEFILGLALGGGARGVAVNCKHQPPAIRPRGSLTGTINLHPRGCYRAFPPFFSFVRT